MSARGPKVRTAGNARRGHKELIRHGTYEPPCELTEAGRAEYDRLLGVLGTKGTLDRVDLAVVAECARIKDLLDRSYRNIADVPDLLAVRLVAVMTAHRRGLLRELGLTTAPCRSVVRANAVPPEESDPLSKLVKLSG